MIIRKPLPCCLPKMQTHISLHRILLFLPKQAVRLQEHTAEAAQLVLEEITIFGAKKYEFAFLEGSRVKVSV